MLLGGQRGTPCQTLRGLEGQVQHIPNFNRIQQHLPQPVLPTQVHTLHLILRCVLQGALQQHAQLHILQDTLLLILQGSLQGALQLVLQCILQGDLQLVTHGSPQGVPLSVLFCATGRGASDNTNHRTSLLYLYLDQGTPFHAHRNILYSTHAGLLHTHRHTKLVEQCQQLVYCTLNAHTPLVHHTR